MRDDCPVGLAYVKNYFTALVTFSGVFIVIAAIFYLDYKYKDFSTLLH